MGDDVFGAVELAFLKARFLFVDLLVEAVGLSAQADGPLGGKGEAYPADFCMDCASGSPSKLERKLDIADNFDPRTIKCVHLTFILPFLSGSTPI